MERDRALVDVARELVHRSVIRGAPRDRCALLLGALARTARTLAFACCELREGVAAAIVGHRPMLARDVPDARVTAGRQWVSRPVVCPAPRPLEGPIPAESSCALVDALLPCNRGAPAAARRLVDASLHDRGLDGVRDEASLLVSEVVTNAVRHAGSGVAVHVDLVDEVVRVEVTDGGPGWPHRREPTVGGWGLNLVQTIATRWGAYPADHGKTVWFELPT